MMIPKNLHILVIDDSEPTRNAVKNAMKINGHLKVSEAENGAEALGLMNELRDTDPVQFIFCDYNMPNLNGMEFLDILKKDKSFSSIPFILITAQSDFELVTQFISKGINQFLVKPFTSESLLERFQLAWDKHFNSEENN
jgi:two-component system, chemotaxis family, chemotaxis protein CheY